MLLRYEDRGEMQRSMRRAGIREVFITGKGSVVRVTALIDSRSMAYYEASGVSAEAEAEAWKEDHFDVIKGEVMGQILSSMGG